ncbi:hypothetical protein O1611_g5871 [Lasiodiplodia mahajangana]|uniref:Uncharacterized protein n=1 Tax=Lasiodiplodia mahajangana TaxID=1108764 RepID=A0ACC2JK30_9PEZI|nr:hypothetical protein O1611_g5871 [Lasiodiplodia mahajangana]
MMTCCQKKWPEYYRDPKWEPPRDLAIPPNFPVQYASPLPGYHPVPGYQGYHPAPTYNLFPNYQPAPIYQPITAPQNFAQVLPGYPVMAHPQTMTWYPAISQPPALTHPMAVSVPQAPQYYSRGPAYGTFVPPRY